MADLGAIGENSLSGEGPLAGIGGIENSLLEGPLTGLAGVENSLALEGPGYQGDVAILAAGSSTGAVTLTGTGSVTATAAGDSSATVVLTAPNNLAVCVAAGDSTAALTLTGTGWILATATGASSATVSFTGAPSLVIFHRASAMQPISFRQNYTGFGFWQRRVSGRQMRVRRLTP